MLLEIEDLTVTYAASSLPAVDRVSLHLDAGESLGLIGESGSGKSTIGRSIINLLPDRSTIHGKISIQDRSVLELSGRALQHYRGEQVALIFQDPMTRLDPLMSIEAHGLEVLRSHQPRLSRKQAKLKLYETFRAVRIDPERARQYPHEFSGGMRQRVAIALSLLLDPPLLIADEPTTSLDVTVAAEILQELTLLRHRRGMSLLLITHDLGLIGQYCDRIAVMYEGSIVETGITEQILRHPQHPYTKSLLDSVIHFKRDFASTPSIDIDLVHSGEERDSLTASPAASTPISSPILLKVRNLNKRYVTGGNPIARLLGKTPPQIKAVDGVDLTINSGDIFGVIGESGSGKSTMGRTILQLIRADTGVVEFDGVDLCRLQGEKLRRIRSQMQMIFQDPRAALNPRMTVFRSIADPLLIHKVVPNLQAAKQRVMAMLEKVGLTASLAERLPRDLSGGQLQRVSIARALITRPRFLICDEPVSMLDATIQSQILQLMLDLKQEFKLTYLFITHDLAVAQFFCTHIAVMRQGKIVEQGIAADVLQNPQHHYTQALLKSVPTISKVDLDV